MKVFELPARDDGATDSGAGVRKTSREETAEGMWRGGASGCYGETRTLPVFAEVGWQLFRQAIAGATIAGQSYCNGQIGVARRKWNDTATIVSSATGRHGHCRAIAGAAEVQHWDVASNLICIMMCRS